jgi:hypothetical protein
MQQRPEARRCRVIRFNGGIAVFNSLYTAGIPRLDRIATSITPTKFVKYLWLHGGFFLRETYKGSVYIVRLPFLCYIFKKFFLNDFH